MSNLKNLVAKANSGLSLRSTPKERFGLNGFLAASTDQMLMTRGGYGASFYNGPSGWSSGGGSGPGGSLGSMGNSITQGFNNMMGSFNSSSVGQFMNGVTDAVINTASVAWDVGVIVGGAAVEFVIGMAAFSRIAFGPTITNPGDYEKGPTNENR
jgi:hypothetical protein